MKKRPILAACLSLSMMGSALLVSSPAAADPDACMIDSFGFADAMFGRRATQNAEWQAYQQQYLEQYCPDQGSGGTGGGGTTTYYCGSTNPGGYGFGGGGNPREQPCTPL